MIQNANGGIRWPDESMARWSDSSPSLFRPEAVKRHRQEPYGEIVLIRPVGLTCLVWLSIGFMVAAVAFLLCGHYTSKAHVSGILLPDKGLIKLYAPQAGTLIGCRVHEGQQVRKGDVLFELSSDRTSLAIASTAAEIRLGLLNRRQSLLQERTNTLRISQQEETYLRTRLEAIRQEQTHLIAEIAAASAKLAQANQTISRYRQMRTANLLSALQLQEKEAEPLEQQKTLEQLERTKVALEDESHNVESSLNKLPLQTQVQSAVLERSISEIDGQLSEHEASQAAVLRAPEEGTISAILSATGSTVQAGSPLATLLPSQATLEAHLYAPSRDVGFIKPGERVLLRYQAYPKESSRQQAGTVSAISQVALTPSEYAFRTGTTAQEPLYEINVTLPAQVIMVYGQPRVLQAEMAIDADILLERRRLIAWVLEPLSRGSGGLAE